MLTISRPLSSGQAQRYHREEFTSRAQSYYAEEERQDAESQLPRVVIAVCQVRPTLNPPACLPVTRRHVAGTVGAPLHYVQAF